MWLNLVHFFQILQLTKEIDDRVHVHKNLEQLYEGKLKNFQNQLEAGQAKAKEQERYIKHLRKRGQSEKDELTKVRLFADSYCFFVCFVNGIVNRFLIADPK